MDKHVEGGRGDLVSDQSDERGFTLIELIVVLTIAALVLTIAIPRFDRRPGRIELMASAREIAASLRLTRGRAIAENRPKSFIADIGNATFGVTEEGALRPLPRGIGLSLYTTQDQEVAASIGTIRFYPDGSSTGGGIALTQGKLSYEVLVNWLNGSVSIHEQHGARGR